MGNIYTLQNGMYSFPLPPIPDPKEIWYHDVPKKFQYWKTSQNKDFRWLNPDGTLKNVSKMSERDKVNYIHYWRDKWENGLWVMVNGEPTFISGGQIDHLIFNKFAGQFMMFLQSQKERFYFRELTNNDPLCDIRVWIKPRRAGITIESITEAIRALLSDTYNNVICQSDTLKKSLDTLLKPAIDTYSKRVQWMREPFYAPQGRKPATELKLTSSQIEEEGDESMGSKMEALPTVASAGDGKDYVLSIIDEFSKHESASPMEMLEVNLKAISPFKKLMVEAISTTGDSKDAAKATLDWHKLIANSNPKVRNPNGKTNSGGYKYFVNAIDSMYVYQQIKQQTGKSIIDQYGYVNKEMAEEWVWNEHNKYQKGTKEYFFSLYKLPLIEQHALLSATVSNLFRKPAIVDRLTYLEGLRFDQKPYIRGRLEEEQNGKVYFEADPAGLWLWAVHPYFSKEKNIDTRNRFRVINDIFYPPINSEGCIGYDPVLYPKDTLKSSNFSQACLFIRKMHDYFNSGIQDTVMALYLGRPDDPHDVNKEAMKACKYTGYPCSHERSVAHVYEDFRDKNMLPFLVQFDGHYGLIANTKNTGDGVSMLQSRYSAPKTPDQKDQIAEHPFEDCLLSHRDFDPANTQPFDPTMAEILCEHGLKQIPFTNATDSTHYEMMNRANEVMPPRRHLVNN